MIHMHTEGGAGSQVDYMLRTRQGPRQLPGRSQVTPRQFPGNPQVTPGSFKMTK